MRFAEFFAGIGLVRMGLEKSGWECAFANDLDPKKREMYRAQFPDDSERFALCDVRELDPADIGPVDLATASFPCTDLSLAGARQGLAGKHSSALWPFLEILRQWGPSRPALVLLENVPGFLTSRGGADFKSALAALNQLGYALDAFVVDALHFAPQSRRRLFVVGALGAEGGMDLQNSDSELRPRALANFILENPDIRWNFRELPPLPKPSRRLDDVLDLDCAEWWPAERARYLFGQMSERHRRVAEEMIAGRAMTSGTVFRRVRHGRTMAELRVDGAAGCLRTPKGGSGRQILWNAGQGRFRARLLTPRECARLMGADDYRLSVPLNQALFGFGDAVCVPAIDWIARNYLNPVLAGARQMEPAAV